MKENRIFKKMINANKEKEVQTPHTSRMLSYMKNKNLTIETTNVLSSENQATTNVLTRYSLKTKYYFRLKHLS